MESSQNSTDIDPENASESSESEPNLNPAHSGHSHAVKIKKVTRPSRVLVQMLLEVSGDVVKQHRKQTINRFSQVARIPGFRPGKAPSKMIEEKYKDDIQKELLSHLVESATHEALIESKLNPLSRPKIQFKQFSETGETPLEFEIEFEVQPEIELRNYKRLPLKATPTEVKEEEVTEAIDNLRERMAVLEPMESEKETLKAEKGLYAVVEIGYDVHTDPPRKEEAKPFTLELGAGNLLPELDQAFQTMSVGDTRTVDARFPEDYSDKELAGKSAVYECKLLELKKKVMPTLDDSFANSLKEGMTLEQLTQEVRENLKSAKIEDSKREQRKQVLDHLISKNPCEIPNSLVQEQMVRLAEWMREDFKRRGMPIGELKEKDVESLRKRAEEMVKGSLLLREVALKEKISLDTTRLDERVKEYAVQMDRSIEDAIKFLAGKGMLDRLKDEVLTDQVYEFLIQNAEVLTDAAIK